MLVKNTKTICEKRQRAHIVFKHHHRALMSPLRYSDQCTSPDKIFNSTTVNEGGYCNAHIAYPTYRRQVRERLL